MDDRMLKPATDIANRNPARFPHESPQYRLARNALLAEEIELRRHIERVAAQRRALPPGGEVSGDFRFVGENGPVSFAQLFGDRQTLIVYSYMFGPQRKEPCPMCTSFMGSFEQKVADIEQKVALAFVARSPIERLVAAKKARGWSHLKVYSDGDGDFTRAYVNAEDGDIPAYNVFTRRDGVIRHFWANEMFAGTADPGQDPRGAPDMDPLWTLLDTTPEGRGANWYPKLRY
jgi:predicted dithiol-disulfide oxidoreductase (DUF899 family)